MHKQSEFLNISVRFIADAGQEKELVSLEASSAFFEVFNRVLYAAISPLLEAKDELEFQENLPDFIVRSPPDVIISAHISLS